MVKQRSLGPDNLDDGSDASSAFLDALRTRAMDDLHLAALEYGIIMKDLAVIDRQFKGTYRYYVVSISGMANEEGYRRHCSDNG